MPVAEAFTDAARAGRLGDLHDLLVGATTTYDDPPRDLLGHVADALADVPADRVGRLGPRPATVMRLLRAGAHEAAWQVVRDNAVGVVAETLRTSTSSGARPTAQRLPLATYVEPPEVFAWLPGFRDPRYGAPDAAYRMTDAVTASVRLDEAWWDDDALVLAGLASLRHLETSPEDAVTVVLRRGSEEVARSATRTRRADLVRGSGADLTRPAWAGWTARVDVRSLPRGTWAASLRVTQQGVTRDARLGRDRLGAVPTSARGAGRTRAELRVDAGLTVTAGLLHLVARRALRR